MSVTYNATLKNARMTAVRDAIDAGVAAGTLEIGTAAMALVLAVVTLSDPSGAIAGGVLTFSGTPLTSAAAVGAGVAAAAQIKDSTGTVVVSGLTVGIAATDIILTSVTIALGDLVRIDSGTITHG